MRNLLFCSIISLLLCATVWSQNKPALIEISLKHSNDVGEISTKNQPQKLIKLYDVSKWIHTKKIEMDRDVQPPYSHPILTLNTKYLKDDEFLRSTFLHEQMHWFFDEGDEQTKKTVAGLKTIFTKVPVGFPEGAMNAKSSYLHLLVCYSEYQAGKELLGELKARQVIEFWSSYHYMWVYKQVLGEERKIADVIRKYKLTIQS